MKGRHKLESVSRRTLPDYLQDVKIPAGSRVAVCSAQDCGGVFIARTQDEIQQQFDAHVVKLDAQGQGVTLGIEQAHIHIPVFHSESVGWCENDHRTITTNSDKTVCDECGQPFIRTEAEPVFQDTLILTYAEWQEMGEEDSVRWAVEEGTRRTDANEARIKETVNQPEPTPEQRKAEAAAAMKEKEADWYAQAAEVARIEAEEAAQAVSEAVTPGGD